MGDAKPKLNIFNLGSLGVNRVLSPIHKRDGELMAAQNAMSGVLQGRDALKKRWGMTQYNGTAFSAPIISIHGLPYAGFADPTTSAYGEPFSVVETSAYFGAPYITPWYWDGASGQYVQTFLDDATPIAFAAGFQLPLLTGNVPEDASGNIYIVAGGNGSYVTGEIYKIDRNQVVTKVADPIGTPTPYSIDGGTVTFTVTATYQFDNTGGDADYVLGSVLTDGDNGEQYQHLWAYKISTDTYTWVGTPQRYTMNVPAHATLWLDAPTTNAVAWQGRLWQNRKWFRDTAVEPVSGFSKIRQIIQSAPLTGGAWSDHKTQDGHVQGESAWIVVVGSQLWTSAEIFGTTGSYPSWPSVFWNYYTTDATGATWTTISAHPAALNGTSTPSTAMVNIVGVDAWRTTPRILLQGWTTASGYGSIAWTEDDGATWNQWEASSGSGWNHFFRAGDNFYQIYALSANSWAAKSSASTYGGAWTTVSVTLADEWYSFGVQGVVRPTVPFTVY